jgi:Tfp pilus assembly protein PilV
MTRYSSKPRLRRCAPKWRGSSLIEVMLAVALMAVTALGLIAGQLWTAREGRAMAMREHAAWIADSVAEAMYVPSAVDVATRQWSARASVLLPHGEASVGESAGVAAALVTWASVLDMPRADDVIDKPESCGGADVPAGSSCVALAFAK